MSFAGESRSETPKVSCLLITADRPHLCRRALRSYRQQTYPNTELIVLDNGEQRIEHLLEEELPDDDVYYRHVDRSPDLWIGGLRNMALEEATNMALEEATGTFIIPQWDDDDWSHPRRIERQVDVLQQGYDACTLLGTLMHVDSERYFNNPFIGILPDGVPPTIMHRRDATIRYPNIRRTSDTDYVNQWREARYTILPRTDSYLYLRYFHGDNLWEKEHFLRRIRNTPKDFLLYGWYQYVHGDLFQHPRFQLTEEMEAAFERYLQDSFAVDLFEEQYVSS